MTSANIRAVIRKQLADCQQTYTRGILKKIVALNVEMLSVFQISCKLNEDGQNPENQCPLSDSVFPDKR